MSQKIFLVKTKKDAFHINFDNLTPFKKSPLPCNNIIVRRMTPLSPTSNSYQPLARHLANVA